MPAGVAEIGGPVVPHGGLAEVGLHADAVGVHQAEVHHRRCVAGFRCLREQARRLQRVFFGDLAVEQDVAQAVHRLDVVLGGGRPQQAQTLLLVDPRAAPLEQRDGERRGGAHVAGVRGLAVPAHGLDLVAGGAGAGGIHPAQAIHDVRVAAVGKPAQHLQEIAVVGRNPPHLHLGLAARRHRTIRAGAGRSRWGRPCRSGRRRYRRSGCRPGRPDRRRRH